MLQILVQVKYRKRFRANADNSVQPQTVQEWLNRRFGPAEFAE